MGVPYQWLRHLLDTLDDTERAGILQALAAEHRLPVSGVGMGIPVLGIWARTAAGRPLIVALRQTPGTDDPLDWTIIGARDMSADELAAFEKWEATR